MIWPGNTVPEGKYPQDFFWNMPGPPYRTAGEKKSINPIMTTLKSQTEVQGTRAGYVIRYTCPSCAAESIIVNKIARDHFKKIHTASCRHCRTRLVILTPENGY